MSIGGKEKDKLKGLQNSVNLNSQKEAANKFNISHVGRRNLSAYDRGLLALKLQALLKIKGVENIVNSNKHMSGSQNSVNQTQVNIDSKKMAANKFNISHDTLNRVKTINSVYNEIVKEEKRNVSFFNCK